MSHRALALLVAFITLGVSCRSASPEPTPGTAPSAAAPTSAKPVPIMSAAALAPLQPVIITAMPEQARGGLAVVVLHGWGAAGDDLVSLARRLAGPRSRFFLPPAPLAQGPHGRAWWTFEPGQRPAHAWNDQLPTDYRPIEQVAKVRQAVQLLLRDIRARYAPERVALVGFSQGGMLSLDVALAAEPPVDRVGVLSGVLIADSLPGLHAARKPRPAFFISHGRSDTMLPFQGGEGTARLLEKYGFSSTFHAFDGGHSIPPEVVASLKAFLYDGL